ncbi:UEV-domain-containing protein [Thozetella sp. PMI_491]|nr:UEV-domain-containing protein [Thozetella sp. PMI_491]
MVVQQHVLNWLYSVLTSEYHDVNRTYNDIAQALSQYPSLSPRTDVHTFPNGASALLLHLSGTIPVVFRGTSYRFPISLWVPHAYPREAPLVYVTPTENMLVRPGQHVDPQGQVYHPYLVGWATFWDKSSILDFLAILRDIFAKEPPVIAKNQARPGPAQQQTPTPPPVPPLPPHLSQRPDEVSQSPSGPDSGRPPPPPPKPGIPGPSLQHQLSSAAPQSGPPLPPLPPSARRPLSQYESAAPEVAPPQHQAPPPGPSRYDAPAHLPPQGPYPGQGQPVLQNDPRYQAGPPPITQGPPPQGFPPGPPQPPFLPSDPRLSVHSQQQPSYTATPPPSWQQATSPAQQPTPKAPPPPDLMDDDLTLNIPSPSSVPAPPIPPNPEKDALLHQLAQALYALRQRSRAQNESSLAGLQAQRTAMLSALNNIQSDLASLSQLSALLNSNTAILKDSLRKADGVIEDSARHPAPSIDDLLVAPTVVGNQLYELVAEERALGDAIFVLGRAMERGRIAPGIFARMTRTLAREWYLKKALVRKIGVGMGLV